ncbi:MAG TPA: hypothetical protein PK657_09205 [Legionella sp.]|nr:hypothetical protein [Legionella sp.]
MVSPPEQLSLKDRAAVSYCVNGCRTLPTESNSLDILPNTSVTVNEEGERKVSFPPKGRMPINAGTGLNNNLQADLSDDNTSTSEPRLN